MQLRGARCFTTCSSRRRIPKSSTNVSHLGCVKLASNSPDNNGIVDRKPKTFGIRFLSTHLTIRSLNQSSPITFQVDLMKVPSNLGYYSSRVNRLYNEDRWSCGIMDIEGDKVFGFGVFDGHGGEECSDYIKQNLYKNIEQIDVGDDTLKELKKLYTKLIGGYFKRWGRKIGETLIKECGIISKVEDYYNRNEAKLGFEYNDVLNGERTFELLERMLKDEVIGYCELLKIRIWLGYISTDLKFLKFENDYNQEKHEKIINSGTTCTSGFVYSMRWKEGDLNHYFYGDNVLSKLVVGHIGDTRAIICDKNGMAHALTKDHHPSNPIEATRLRKFSSGMIMTDSFGEERYLNFANTRSFGDLSAKNIGISSEPEFTEFLIGDGKMIREYKESSGEDIADFGGNECFLVFVSDGVTNVITEQEVVDLIKSTFNNKGHDHGTPQKCCEEVIKFVECVGGDDNSTCVIVRLSGWGHWPLHDLTGKSREDKMLNVRRGRYR